MGAVRREDLTEGKDWPILRSAQELDCDGKNPVSGSMCVLGYHQGYHRDDVGVQWLDDGDLARPDWLGW
ncbi:hypothetical protein ACIBL3_46490 [Kribbella sp. NPDC050124]|uniref:hypothetical protein n=1 Tax=Kribbella sp. NPDC050124 TaxID=3364114 RepID=UPI00378ED96A